MIPRLFHHLDRHHHAFIFMLDHVAVEHEPPNNFGVREGDDEFRLPGLTVSGRWNTIRVAQTIEFRRPIS